MTPPATTKQMVYCKRCAMTLKGKDIKIGFCDSCFSIIEIENALKQQKQRELAGAIIKSRIK